MFYPLALIITPSKSAVSTASHLSRFVPFLASSYPLMGFMQKQMDTPVHTSKPCSYPLEQPLTGHTSHSMMIIPWAAGN